MESKPQIESRWYLSPGQSLESTKIEDRGHALHMTKKTWWSFIRHLDRKALEELKRKDDIARKLALQEGSKKMTRNWDNSVENVRIRKEEERLARHAKTRNDKMQQFHEMRKEQEKIRLQFIADAMKSAYISKGHPKSLTGALIESEVMLEREKQLELEKAIKKHELEEAAIYAQKVKEGAKQEALEKLEKEAKIQEKKLEIKKEYEKDMREREELRKAQKKGSIQRELLDIKNADKEFKQIKAMEIQQDKQKKAKVKREFHEFHNKQLELRKYRKLEEKETEVVIEIYSRAKHDIQCLRKKKEKEMQDALQARREAASKKATAAVQAKEAEELRILQKAVGKKEKEALEKIKAEAQYQKQLLNERLKDHEVLLKRLEKEQNQIIELRKFDMLNRLKTDEVTRKYNEDKQKRLWKATLKYRAELSAQMKEKAEARKKEKQEIIDHELNEQSKLAQEDKKFFEYAEECMAYVKSTGASTLPIQRVMKKYRKENNLRYNTDKFCKDYWPKK